MATVAGAAYLSHWSIGVADFWGRRLVYLEFIPLRITAKIQGIVPSSLRTIYCQIQSQRLLLKQGPSHKHKRSIFFS